VRLKDKVAIITGGASGMGKSTAEIFVREGARVVIADVLEQEGNELAQAIRKNGGDALFVHLDVTKEDAWQAAVSKTVERYGQINALVNNAGISGFVPDVLSTEYFDRMMAVNTRSVFLGMKHTVPEMKKAGGGSIVNMSSIAGFAGFALQHMGYNAAKAANRLLTRSAAADYGKDGIRVNVVAPGLMPPMRTSVATSDPKVRAKIFERVPLGRGGRVEEVANAILFLISDEASYITGIDLVVDGGYLAG
jgi:NAD(P)-dependent dehydrogenase (short-subunit alcohol dehydrogenase family)